MGKEASAFFVTKGGDCEYSWLPEKEKEKEKEGMVMIMMDSENVEMMEGVEYTLSTERM